MLGNGEGRGGEFQSGGANSDCVGILGETQNPFQNCVSLLESALFSSKRRTTAPVPRNLKRNLHMHGHSTSGRRSTEKEKMSLGPLLFTDVLAKQELIRLDCLAL